MSQTSTIGSRIRTLREQEKLTQADLGAEIGISRSHLSKIESGKDPVGREALTALARKFDVSLDWLAKGIGDPRPASATSEREALLLFAFRNMPPEEGELHLSLMLKRVQKKN